MTEYEVTFRVESGLTERGVEETHVPDDPTISDVSVEEVED